MHEPEARPFAARDLEMRCDLARRQLPGLSQHLRQLGVREHEPGLSLHEREVPPAERRLLGRRQKQVAGALPKLLRRGPLVLVLLEGED